MPSRIIRTVPGALADGWVAPGGAALLVVLGLTASVEPAAAQTFLTQDEALELAFPGARTERRTAYLGDEELERADRLAGDAVAVEQGVVTYYLACRDGEPAGVAYFDVHRVRTLPEVLMVVVDPDGTIGRIEVLQFTEPPGYLAPDGWLEQFPGRHLDDDLSVKGDIVNITGATLTSRAVTGAARRVLALHRTIDPVGREDSAEGDGPCSRGARVDERAGANEGGRGGDRPKTGSGGRIP